MNVFEGFVENDTLPVIAGVLTEDDGTTPIPLTGATITLHVGYETPLVVPATVVSEVGGSYYFPWAVGDLREGTWECEVQVKWSETAIQTAKRNSTGDKFKIKVDKEIA